MKLEIRTFQSDEKSDHSNFEFGISFELRISSFAILIPQPFEHRFDELVGVENREVLGLLADPHEFDRQPELLADRHDHAPLGGPIDLGQHDAGTLYRFGKTARLADPV